MSDNEKRLIFNKYNHNTGEKQYIMMSKKEPEPEGYCERCGKKKHTKMCSQGHYFYLCNDCYDKCFHWNGTYLEFTSAYHNEYMKRLHGLMGDSDV